MKCLDIDLLGIKTADDLCKRMVKEIVSFNRQNSTMLQKLLTQFAALRPSLGIDPITGLPTVSITQAQILMPEDLESVFDVITGLTGTVIFFDEFQDILELPDGKKILSIMRSRIQKLTDKAFIFAGSIRNKMIDIFTVDSWPFYKSAFPLSIGPLEKEIFFNYLKNKFLTGKRTISDDLLNRILQICGDVPGDVQRFCTALWEVSSYNDELNDSYLKNAWDNIFAMELPVYEEILFNISAQQLKCLVALARLGGESPLSGDLVIGSGITLAGSVNKALNRLVEIRVLQKQNKKFKFCNPFFKSWLLVKNI